MFTAADKTFMCFLISWKEGNKTFLFHSDNKIQFKISVFITVLYVLIDGSGIVKSDSF